MKRFSIFTASLALLFLSTACTKVQEQVAQPESPNCDAPAAKRNALTYWIAGQGPYAVNWTGCDKAGAQLASTALGTSDLTDTDLSGANLKDADLGATLMRRTKLSGADLQGAILSAAYLEGVDLTKANLTGAHMNGGTYTDVDFSGATWTDGSKVCAEGSIDTCR